MSTNVSVQIEFHATLKKVFGEKSKGITQSSPLTVRRLLEILCTTRPLHETIFDDSGQLRSTVTVLRNGRNIVFLEGLDTTLNDGDKIALFPPVTGG